MTSGGAGTVARVLRQERRARFVAERRLVLRRYRFTAGPLESEDLLSPGELADLMGRQAMVPIPVLEDDRRTWWLFRDKVFWEDDGLSADDVRALALERERRRGKQLARAHDQLLLDRSTPRREGVPESVKRAVFRRDGGACTRCGSNELLQFDHIIPVALGGASSLENLQLLCADCNREKGASL